MKRTPGGQKVLRLVGGLAGYQRRTLNSSFIQLLLSTSSFLSRTPQNGRRGVACPPTFTSNSKEPVGQRPPYGFWAQKRGHLTARPTEETTSPTQRTRQTHKHHVRDSAGEGCRLSRLSRLTKMLSHNFLAGQSLLHCAKAQGNNKTSQI